MKSKKEKLKYMYKIISDIVFYWFFLGIFVVSMDFFYRNNQEKINTLIHEGFINTNFFVKMFISILLMNAYTLSCIVFWPVTAFSMFRHRTSKQ